jgi:hypothetical protein
MKNLPKISTASMQVKGVENTYQFQWRTVLYPDAATPAISDQPARPKCHFDERTNEFPSGSLKVTKLPQGSFLGGAENSTPRCFSS